MEEGYYIFEQDNLLNNTSRLYAFSSFEKANESYFEIRDEFMRECHMMADCLTETVIAPGYIQITDGEDYYRLVLARGL